MFSFFLYSAFTEKQPMTTKEKLLQSALKLFAKQGIDKTSTTQITEDVGVAAGTLFVHFKTKQELIDTLYIGIKKGAFSGLGDLINKGYSAERNAKLIAETAITYFLDNYDAFIFMELVEKDPQISEEALEAAREEFAQLSVIIQRWLDEGELKEIDLELIQGIVWSISAVIVKYLKANDIKEVDEIFLDIIWEAIKK